MDLLSTDRWSGRIFTGAWVATGQRAASTEPATGEGLAEVGMAGTGALTSPEEIFGPVAPATTFAVNDEVVAPFGGRGASGTGAFGTLTNLDELTRWQWVTLHEQQASPLT